MLVIGLTGATGAGKGLFGKIASEKFGLCHIDTDKTARFVVQPGKPCLEEIKAFFGTGVVTDEGTLDRKALAKIVFSDTDKIKALNRITHHYITDEVNKAILKAKNDGMKAVVIDAPLLFESGENKLCDVTVGVVANKVIRKQRIMVRDGITEEMAENRIASGKNEDFFKERCDHIIENNADEKEFQGKCERLLEILIK